MTVHRLSIDDDLRWIAARVRADLPPGEESPRIRIDPAFVHPERGAGPGDDPADAVVEVGASRTRIGLENGREAACRSVMSAVQDAVIDRIGAPWPEVIDNDGGFVGVLDVEFDDEGHAVWSRGADIVGPIGHLIASCVARGWRVRV